MQNRFFKAVCDIPPGILAATIGGFLDGCKFQDAVLDVVPKGTGLGLASIGSFFDHHDLPALILLYFAAFSWGVLASSQVQSFSNRPKM